MLWFATICNFRAYHNNPENPCKTGHSGAKQGETKLWLKYGLFVTAIFVYSHEMLVKSGLSENDRENLPLFCPWNSNGIIGLPDKKCNIYNWHDTIRIYIRNIMEK